MYQTSLESDYGCSAESALPGSFLRLYEACPGVVGIGYWKPPQRGVQGFLEGFYALSQHLQVEASRQHGVLRQRVSDTPAASLKREAGHAAPIKV